jgi:hypothetical protein
VEILTCESKRVCRRQKKKQKGEPEPHIRGAVTVASQAVLWSRTDLSTRRASSRAPPASSPSYTGDRSRSPLSRFKNGKIAEINFLAHPDRIAHLDLTELGD